MTAVARVSRRKRRRLIGLFAAFMAGLLGLDIQAAPVNRHSRRASAATFSGPSGFPRTRGDFETTSRTLVALAAFVNGRADEFLHQAFHRPAHRGVFAGQRRKRAALAADDVLAGFLDAS